MLMSIVMIQRSQERDKQVHKRVRIIDLMKARENIRLKVVKVHDNDKKN